jgi:transposase
MANKSINMLKLRQILRYYTQGTSKKQISAITGIARNTVKRYISRFISLYITYEDIVSLSDHELEKLFMEPNPKLPDERFDRLQQLLPDIEKQMSRKGVTLLQLWGQYAGANKPAYQYTQFKKYYHFYNNRVSPVMHMEHKAGDKMYIDFAGDKLSIVDKDSGEIKEVEVFAAILGCSQLTYVEAVMSQRKEDLISACQNALHYFGGVPAAIVPDNLRSAVTKSSKYEPLINESFADFAEHYGTVVLPARAYRPKDKALVEGIVKIIYSRIYPFVQQQIYYTLDTLNTAILQSLELHNTSAFKGRDYSRRQQFEELEKHTLKSLPQFRYECKQQLLVTVMKNGHVCLGADKHYYSVPYRFIGKKVKLLYTSSQVEVFYKYERIAIHKRAYLKYHYTTSNEHLASAHRYLSEWTPEKFIEEATLIHTDVATYIIAVIEHKQHPEQAYKSCSGILSLQKKVGNERLANACRRAGSFGIYNYPIVVQILEKKLDQISEDDKEELPMPEHHNIRGEDYYQ